MKRLLHLLKRFYQLTIFRFKGGVAYARLIGVKVGSGCRIYTDKFGSEPQFIEIGDRVTVTSGVSFLTHDGSTWLFRDENGRRYHYNRIRIGNDVFVGINTILMPGVIIENKVIIGAGSVVTKSIPTGSIVAGNPAKKIGEYKDFEKKALDSFLSDKMRRELNVKEKILNKPKKYIGE